MTITKVIDEGFCVGCGACKSANEQSYIISLTSHGFYEASRTAALTDEQNQSASQVCPFSDDAKNEDELAKQHYSQLDYDKNIGFYQSVFTGNISDKDKRLESSSGGLTTWFIEKLFEKNQIDAVVNVGQNDTMFEYKIAHSISQLHQKENKKSRYYPVSYEKLIDYILTSDDRILFVGIPCFVKSIRLLQDKYNLNNIKYVFSLLCGHMKSAAFSECLSWQIGIPPKKLNSIDFRVKEEGYKASDYFISVKDKSNNEKLQRNFSLFGSDWGIGFFKHKACDFCDDIGGELADMTFGDAWLPKYINDYLGTNIVISRKAELTALLNEFKQEVNYEFVPVQDFIDSQAANFRHRRDGLKVRVQHAQSWTPKKRLELCEEVTEPNRQQLYLFRHVISAKSNQFFHLAKKLNSFLIFKLLMTPYLVKYDMIRVGRKKALKAHLKKLNPFNKVK